MNVNERQALRSIVTRNVLGISAVLWLIIGLCIIKLQKVLQLTANDWNVSEWLIDYRSGFIRRGLGGAILLFLRKTTDVEITTLIISVTFAIYCLLFTIFWLRLSVSKINKRKIWHVVILLSPNLIIFPISSGSFLRNDTIFVLFMSINITVFELLLNKHMQKCYISLRVSAICVMISLTATFLAANHEGLYLFCFLPMNVLILFATAYRIEFNNGRHRVLVFVVIATVLIPSLMVACLSVIWHGNAQMAEAICLSWQGLGSGINCNQGIPAAVAATGWGLEEALGPVEELLLQGGMIWYAIAFLALSMIQIVAIAQISEKPRTDVHGTIIMLSFLASLPLFIVGADWGRFFFVLSMQTTFVMLSQPVRDAIGDYLPQSLIVPVQRLFAHRRTGAAMQMVRRHPIVICTAFVFIGIPAAQMTPHAAVAQSVFSIIVHVLHPSFGIM